MIKGKGKTQGSEENIRRNREKAYPSSTCMLCAVSAVKAVGGVNEERKRERETGSMRSNGGYAAGLRVRLDSPSLGFVLLSLGLYHHGWWQLRRKTESSTSGSCLDAREVMEGADALKKPTSDSRLDARGGVVGATALNPLRSPPPARVLM